MFDFVDAERNLISSLSILRNRDTLRPLDWVNIPARIRGQEASSLVHIIFVGTRVLDIIYVGTWVLDIIHVGT